MKRFAGTRWNSPSRSFGRWWPLPVLLVLLLAAGCGSVGPRRVAEEGLDNETKVTAWAGVWTEQWPEAEEQDKFRINLLNDGYTIQIDPLTNAGQQVLADLRWDGKTLQFTNYIDSRPIYYILRIDDTGEVLNGTVRSAEGRVNQIQWIKEGSSYTPAESRQTVEADLAGKAVDLADWAGNWEEEWPDRQERDAYRIRLDGDRLTLETLSNIEKQGFELIEWNGRRLAFVLRFSQSTLGYELFQDSANRLIGIVTMPDGVNRRIAWNRVGPAPKGRRIAAKQLNGTWKEYWPGRGDNDLYQIRLLDEKRASISPVTNAGRQSLAGAQWAASELSFQLTYDQNTIVYRLKLTDPNTLSGEIRLPDGRIAHLAWLRIGE